VISNRVPQRALKQGLLSVLVIPEAFYSVHIPVKKFIESSKAEFQITFVRDCNRRS
jgi:hypothetical protein